jgi:catechol 2,3-dioxygenase-like lactoylglutathione lyase family enzyme
MVKAVALDHVVLNVADVERSLAWYCGELGLEGLRVEEWRRGEVFFPSLRLDETTIIDLLQTDRTGQNVDPRLSRHRAHRPRGNRRLRPLRRRQRPRSALGSTRRREQPLRARSGRQRGRAPPLCVITWRRRVDLLRVG